MNSKEFRTYKQMTQKSLAQFLNVSVRTIENWELREYTPPAVASLFDYVYALEKLGRSPLPY